MVGTTALVESDVEGARSETTLASRSAHTQADRDLMERVACGDQEAFKRLYDLEAPLLFSVIYRILNDAKEAEDTLQETFVQIWKKAADYRADRAKITTWSVMIARCRAIDKIRSRNRHSDVVARMAAIEDILNPQRAEAQGQLLAEEANDRIKKAIGEIGDHSREAILLAFYSGLTHVQIAQHLHVPLGTVKARIRRGLLALREALQEPATERSL